MGIDIPELQVLSTHHLLRCHANGFDGELATAHVEKVLQIWAQKVNREDIMEALLTKMVNLRDTS